MSCNDNSRCCMLGDTEHDGAFEFDYDHWRRDVECISCHAHNFKSATREAGRGDASQDRWDWILDIDPGIVDSSAILDVLICQTRECGRYCVISLSCLSNNRCVCVEKVDTDTSTKSLEHKRRHILETLSMFPVPVANLVIDHLMAEPGSFVRDESEYFQCLDSRDSRVWSPDGVHVVSIPNGQTVNYSYRTRTSGELE